MKCLNTHDAINKHKLRLRFPHNSIGQVSKRIKQHNDDYAHKEHENKSYTIDISNTYNNTISTINNNTHYHENKNLYSSSWFRIKLSSIICYSNQRIIPDLLPMVESSNSVGKRAD